MAQHHQALTGWTIYDHPSDFPRHVVVRAWTVSAGSVMHAPVACLCDSLTEARACVPLGLTNLHRYADDDPVITESWV